MWGSIETKQNYKKSSVKVSFPFVIGHYHGVLRPKSPFLKEEIHVNTML